MEQISLALIILVGLFALIDFMPRIFIAKKRQPKVAASYTPTPNYLILPTVYGDVSYLQNLSFLKKYNRQTVICTTKYESPQFYRALRKICRQNGLRYIAVDVPKSRSKPLKNPYAIYRGAFVSGRLKVRKDTPCLLMDADTYALSNVNNLARAFEASGYDVASLRCEASKPKNLIEKLQAFEYKLAMDGRNMDPWLTSGACNISRAGALKRIFKSHSNFFVGGDIEIGKLAQIMGLKIGHLDFTFYTAVPSTFKEWFKQRVMWFSGGIRHHVINVSSFSWWHFFLLFYNSLLIYLLLPIRWLEFINLPLLAPLIIIFSWTYIYLLVGPKNWRVEYLALPLYSFVQTMIILPLAMFKYINLAWTHKSLGLLKQDLSAYSLSQIVLFKSLNYGTTLVVLVTALTFSITRINYWSEHSTILNSLKSLFASWIY